MALTLAKASIDYVLLEQAPALTEVGAGIQLSPNGVRIMEWLGTGNDLARDCNRPDFHKFVAWDTGEVLLRTALMPKAQEQFGAPYYHAYRPDLIDALTKPLDRSQLKLGIEVTSIGQDAGKSWAETADGTHHEGDVLIGADGIHSLVREQVFRPDAPRPSGYMTWRGVVDAEKISHLDIPVSAYVIMGPRLSFVCYFVAAGKKFNWIALGQSDDALRESWSQTANKDDVLAAFNGWYDVPRKVIEATEEMFVTALFDREPLPTWVDGRIALMGDAAHAMLPYHAQGAVQSIEDAWVLGRLLDLSDGKYEGALKRYEALRCERTNRLVQHSRSAQSWHHFDDPTEVEARNAKFRATDERVGGEFTQQQTWLYAYDAEKAVLGTDNEWQSLPIW